VVSLVAATADARPKRREARREFDRGVTAYQKGNFEVAAEALGKSYELERDVDTLFAWAQAERKLERCDKAIELYQKLIDFNLPPANKSAVEQKLEECRVIIAAQAPRAEPPPAPAPATPPAAEPTPPPAAAAMTDPPPASPEVPRDTPSRARTWYRDPITLALLGAGVVGTGVGTGFLISARAEHVAAPGSATLEEARQHSDNAKARLRLGFITGGVGVALVGGGVAWLILHRDSGERRTVTGWLAPGGGGLAITGPW
jgi:tetratricopeptide (TPR) repeat protein